MPLPRRPPWQDLARRERGNPNELARIKKYVCISSGHGIENPGMASGDLKVLSL